MSKYSFCEDGSRMFNWLEKVKEDLGVDVSLLSPDAQAIVGVILAVKLIDTLFKERLF